jgi:hypothetical protein
MLETSRSSKETVRALQRKLYLKAKYQEVCMLEEEEHRKTVCGRTACPV